MAHKGNQQKNGLDRHSFNHKRKVSDSGYGVPDTKGRGQAAEVKTVAGEELPNGNQASNPLTGTTNKTTSAGDEKKSKQRSGKSLRKDKQEMGTTHGLDHSVPRGSDPRESDGNVLKTETCGIREENVTSPRTNSGSKHPSGSSGFSPNGLPSENAMKNPEFSDTMVVRSLRASALSILKAANEWLERQKPFFISLSTKILNVRDLIRMKIEQTYPIILKWLMYFGNITLLLSMVWLDCTIRGIDSFLRMGTTSFFSVIWCSIFSVVAMIGMSKFLIILVSPIFTFSVYMIMNYLGFSHFVLCNLRELLGNLWNF